MQEKHTAIEGETVEYFLFYQTFAETEISAALEQMLQGDIHVCPLTNLHPPGVVVNIGVDNLPSGASKAQL